MYMAALILEHQGNTFEESIPPKLTVGHFKDHKDAKMKIVSIATSVKNAKVLNIRATSVLKNELWKVGKVHFGILNSFWLNVNNFLIVL